MGQDCIKNLENKHKSNRTCYELFLDALKSFNLLGFWNTWSNVTTIIGLGTPLVWVAQFDTLVCQPERSGKGLDGCNSRYVQTSYEL